MSEPLIPPALVLGCNTPHGIGVLSDWIEEQTGHAPDFVDTGWSDRSDWSLSTGDGDGCGDGQSFGYGRGCGIGYGELNGDGRGTGYGYPLGNFNDYSDGRGCGYIYGYGYASIHEDGNGWGYSIFYDRNSSVDDINAGSTKHSGFWQRIGQRLRQLIE